MRKSNKFLYKLALNASYFSGFTWLLNKLNDDKIRILMYHRINSVDDGFLPWNFDLYVTPKNFEKQIRYLKRNYNVVSLGEACEFLRQGNIPKKTVVLTFDDGFMDNYKFAYPILRKYNVPGIFFVVSKTLEDKDVVWLHKYYFLRKKGVKIPLKGNVHFNLKYKYPHKEMEKLINESWKEQGFINFINGPYFGEEEIKGMEGMSFGSHTRSHVAVSKLIDEDKYEEIVGSKKKMENIVKCDHFAYPFGDRNSFDAVSRQIVSEHYKSGLTTFEGFVKEGDDRFALNRLSVVDGNLNEFKGTLGGLRAFLIKCYSKL
tara:strand:+ start:406 stop:1356 length:951 start_codon:yes stop_codon:yes gene_type:complete